MLHLFLSQMETRQVFNLFQDLWNRYSYFEVKASFWGLFRIDSLGKIIFLGFAWKNLYSECKRTLFWITETQRMCKAPTSWSKCTTLIFSKNSTGTTLGSFEEGVNEYKNYPILVEVFPDLWNKFLFFSKRYKKLQKRIFIKWCKNVFKKLMTHYFDFRDSGNDHSETFGHKI